jgi:peptide/nickel transport system permease protein
MVQQTDVIVRESGIGRARSDRGALDRSQLRSTPGFYARSWRRFRQDKVAVVGLLMTAIIVAFVLAAPLISNLTGHTYSRGQLGQNFRSPFTEDHLLGTDGNGRDILVRLAYGGRISLLVAGLAAVTILVIGGFVGSVAGYFGGFIDSILMRIVDVLLSIPFLSILLLVSVLYRPGVIGLSILIAVLGWAGIARLIRGEVLSLRSRDYIDAARVIGATNGRIIVRHILPNVVPIMIVWLSLAIPSLILAEAALSFLGFGVRIPTPSWGNMLEGATQFYTKSWTNVFIPGFMIYLTVFAINLVGNGLRDAFDPRLND